MLTASMRQTGSGSLPNNALRELVFDRARRRCIPRRDRIELELVLGAGGLDQGLVRALTRRASGRSPGERDTVHEALYERFDEVCVYRPWLIGFAKTTLLAINKPILGSVRLR